MALASEPQEEPQEITGSGGITLPPAGRPAGGEEEPRPAAQEVTMSGGIGLPAAGGRNG